jgi:hypothetical protein
MGLGTFVVYSVGMVVGITFIVETKPSSGLIVAFAIFGIVSGLLHGYFFEDAKWSLVTNLGWILCGFLMHTIGEMSRDNLLRGNFENTLIVLRMGIVGGLILGITQWFLLCRRVRHAWLWILINAFSGTLCWTLYWATWADMDLVEKEYGPMGGNTAAMQNVCVWGPMCMATFGTITGLALVWLARRPKVATTE